MHDKNGTPLQDGDTVTLTGIFTAQGSADSEYCNGQVNIPQLPGTGMTACVTINARHCEKVTEAWTPTGDKNTDAILQNKALRKELDDLLQELKDPHTRKSRERSLAITKLEEAIMWLGMDLKDLGTKNPYPNSKDPTNATVDPTADGLKL
jgi:hypothetical protein